MRSSAVALALALALIAQAERAAAAPAEPPPTLKMEEPPGGAEWRQTFMAPRVTGNLRAVAVDPTDAKNLYVGTEEGTLAHSTDGGITWDEIELSPFLLKSPTTSVKLADASEVKVIDVFAGFNTYVPPNYYSANGLVRFSAAQGAPIAGPPNVGSNFVLPFYTYAGTQPLLGAVAAADPQGYQELVRIVVCPGSDYGVLVATKTKLHGSSDGSVFAPIFSTRDASPITDVACSPTKSNEIVVATGDGTMISTDGGGSFDVMPGDMGPAASTALAYLPGDKERLLVATGRDLWLGETADADGLKSVPLAGAVSGDIRSIAATKQSIWLATDSGAAVSHDQAVTWSAIDELETSKWLFVAAAAQGGRERVAFLREDAVFESKGGEPFTVYFRALSRRRLRQIAASSEGFYLLTSGEVWTSTPPRTPRPGDESLVRWAETRLQRLPSLAESIHLALVKARLTDDQIDDVESAFKKRAWLPGLTIGAFYNGVASREINATKLTKPTDVALVGSNGNYFVSAFLVWELPDLVAPSAANAFAPIKRQLYEMQKRLSFVVEDASDERRQVLTQIAGGGLDADELLTLQARLEVLDVVLQQLTGASQ